MGVLLDENIPVDLAGLRSDHDAQTVSGFGWDGVKTANFCVALAGPLAALPLGGA